MGSTLMLAVVFDFDLVAFALAIAAEQRRASARIVQDCQILRYSHKIYPNQFCLLPT
ncbi:hypothetical protein HanXRQr2_Chr17g0816081 [Helianthus annuus]|uniref:Uncharacterized protein n=1 Tax=Helianthus annuus TaxID=4232 RepID=A0A9K3DJQ0_HELAN|nr:hypothetical protein HanXRQr2_Chr17g0816081 [Helianthus annuus]